MTSTQTFLLIAAAVAIIALAARGLDARADRRRRRDADVAGTYLAEAGQPSGPATAPLPRWITALVAVSALGGAVAAGGVVVGGWADEAQQRSDEITGCRSSFSAELVTGPTAAGLKALGTEGADSPAFMEALEQADPDRFIALSKLSRTDPDRFLTICRQADVTG